MLGSMEEILCELEMNEQGGLPPGFRFHPTDEELITFYLASKVFNGTFSGVEIAEVDLNRCEPWELPDVAKMGEREWYFFSLRDRKYPTGLRTNRATGAGYWKATGKDREVYSSAAPSGALLGMKKTLVFYKGRAPRGQKTKWVMHEYRLDGDFSCRHTGKEEWVICRIFHKIGEKKTPTIMLHQSGQNHHLTKASAFPTTTCNSLPPLLEPPPTLFESQSHQHHLTLNQNPNNFSIHTTQDQSDLKSLIDPLVSPSDFFPVVNRSHGPTSSFANQDSMLLKPLLSHQDFTFKELSNAIARQCKRESNLDHLGHDHDQSRHFRLLSDAFENCNKYDQIQNQLLLSGGGGGEMGLIPSPTTFGGIDNITAVDHVMSTEPAFRWW